MTEGAGFAKVSGRFLEFIRGSEPVDASEIPALITLLADLVAVAATLPDVDAPPGPTSSANVFPLRSLPAGLYWSVLDPLAGVAQGSPPATGLGDLAEDLADIERDVAFGLQVWNGGGEEAQRIAVWEWRFSFRVHLGRHAADALGVPMHLMTA